ncbi:TPA: hypothetical protein JAN72_06565 [Legionella pneumophila]|uniref:Uncharacterized protein n=1 Tax=Legionella pneumophila TaxID=446 RepID=A0AAN5R601_LEGPN|nr:hypothetical protein [Legionella pneumophila]HAT1972305.1 hypothetical protein [Legionella pneumophila]HAT6956424.1 hypothetical protein [Legionella pneumophila]HEN4771754.1 hypothetical protein [Legionella pneumophila]
MENKNPILNLIDQLKTSVLNLVELNQTNQSINHQQVNTILHKNCLVSQKNIIEKLENELQKRNLKCLEIE